MNHIEIKQIFVKPKGYSNKHTLDELFSECYALSVKHHAIVTLHHGDKGYDFDYLAISGLLKTKYEFKNNEP